jgi:ESCRT-II complex subunit VPS22
MSDLIAGVEKRRGTHSQAISDDDVSRAIDKVSVLGNGFRIIRVKGHKVVLSVPIEMSLDDYEIMSLAETTGCFTVASAQQALKWEEERIQRVLRVLLEDGMVWIDVQHPDGTAYWFPSLWKRGSDPGRRLEHHNDARVAVKEAGRGGGSEENGEEQSTDQQQQAKEEGEKGGWGSGPNQWGRGQKLRQASKRLSVALGGNAP